METFHRLIEVKSKSCSSALYNFFPSFPSGYTVYMKETYENMTKLLCAVYYDKFKWQISSDLKVISILLGLQQSYAKFCCFCIYGTALQGFFTTDRTGLSVNYFNLEHKMLYMNHSLNQAKLYSLLFM